MSADVVERINSRSPMDGWSMAGVVPTDLGTHGPILDRLAGSEHWPVPELHQGVAGVQFRTWADDNRGGYLTVWGPDRAAVEARWAAIAEALDFAVFWGTA